MGTRPSFSESTRVIDGKAIGAALRAEVATELRRFASKLWRSPALTTILIGDDPASAVYLAAKR